MVVVHDTDVVYRPCLLLAHADAVLASQACRRFRRVGWDVYQAAAADEAWRLARMLQPEVIVLDVDLLGESAWRSWTRLRDEHPDLRLVLVGNDTPPNRCHADEVGACALVSPQEGMATLIQAAMLVPTVRAG